MAQKEENGSPEIIRDSALKKQICETYEIEEFVIDRIINARAINKSWDWIERNEFGSEQNEHDVEFLVKRLSNDEELSELVTQKKHDFKLLELGVEEQVLIEKLLSIMRGESQGKQYMKLVKQVFNNGKMEKNEELVEVERYPTTTEIIKATTELHKLGFLDAKEKAKIQIEQDKASREQGELMEQMLQVHKTAEEAERMAEIQEVEISLDDYNLTGEQSDNVEDKEEEFSMEELQDF